MPLYPATKLPVQLLSPRLRLLLIALSDMQPYAPSQGAPAMFIATALRAPGGSFLGVLAFELPTDELLKIMNYAGGGLPGAG